MAEADDEEDLVAIEGNLAIADEEEPVAAEGNLAITNDEEPVAAITDDEEGVAACSKMWGKGQFCLLKLSQMPRLRNIGQGVTRSKSKASIEWCGLTGLFNWRLSLSRAHSSAKKQRR